MRYWTISTLTTALSVSCGLSSVAEAAIYRVDDSAPGGNGSSWLLAINDLQTAFGLAQNPGDKIWVAQGTYLPGTDREDSFVMRTGVEVWGGYAGAFTGDPGQDPDERDVAAFETILSGDLLGGDDPQPDEAFWRYGYGTTATTWLTAGTPQTLASTASPSPAETRTSAVPTRTIESTEEVR